MVAAEAGEPATGEVLTTLLRAAVIHVLPWFIWVPFFPLPGTPFSLDDVIPLLIGGAGLALRCLSGGRPRFEAVATGLLVLAVLNLGATLATSSSDSDLLRSAARGFGRISLHAALLVTVAWSLRDVRDVERMLKTVVLAAIAQSLFCVFAYVADYRGPAGIGMATTPEWMTQRRAHGTFSTGSEGIVVSSNFLGAYMMCATVVAIGLAVRTAGRPRLWWYAAAAVCSVGIALSLTRASFAGLGLGVLVLTFLVRRVRLGIGIVVLGVLSVVTIPELRTRFSNLESDRMALYVSGSRIAWDYPHIGIGEGHYPDVYGSSPRYQYTPHGKATTTPHNSLVLTADYAGWLAALVMLAVLLLSVGRSALWALWSEDYGRRTLLATLSAGCAAFLLQAQVNDLFYVPKTAIFFWIFVGLSLVVGRGVSPPRAASVG